jgi:hypothetical protein
MLMPRLVKGGTWVYGWVVVGRQGEIIIPPEAWREFGFQAGAEAVFVSGSRRSGGFAISTPDLTSEVSDRLDGAMLRVFAHGRSDAGCIVLPPPVGGAAARLGFCSPRTGLRGGGEASGTQRVWVKEGPA